MKRLLALVLLTLIAGCRAPMPSFDVLAPYGSTRVPPPSTGSYGSTEQYYGTPTSQSEPAVGTGFRAKSTSTNGSEGAPESVKVATNSAATATTASFESSDDSSLQGLPDPPGRVRIGQPATGSTKTTTTQLRGMPVNDATGVAEPAVFTPPTNVIDISQLPTGKPEVSVLTKTSNIVTSSSADSTANSKSGPNGWKTR